VSGELVVRVRPTKVTSRHSISPTDAACDQLCSAAGSACPSPTSGSDSASGI
jgi:hypothetical protein